MAGILEMASQQPTTAAKLHNQPVPVTDGLEEPQDAGRHHVGVKSESQVVDQGEGLPIVRRTSRIHSVILAHFRSLP